MARLPRSFKSRRTCAIPQTSSTVPRKRSYLETLPSAELATSTTSSTASDDLLNEVAIDKVSLELDIELPLLIET
jgi:hypothetical protein